MSYICSKPATYFVSKGNKFARLGYEESHHERHCACSLQCANSEPIAIPALKRKKVEPLMPPPPSMSYPPAAISPPPMASPYSALIPSQSLNLSVQFPMSPPPYSTAGFITSCSPPAASTEFYPPAENLVSLYRLENEGRMLSQEFSKHAGELAAFCQRLTTDWANNRGASNMDPETAKCWSYLCTQGMALQHVVKSMVAAHGKFLELINLHKLQRQFPAMQQPQPSIGLRPEMVTRYMS